MSQALEDFLKSDTFRQPPFALERKLDIQGIGRHYKLPPGFSAESFQVEMMRQLHWEWGNVPQTQRLQRALAHVDQLIRLNPELAGVGFNRDVFIDAWHILLGVASGFNPDDIHHFINQPHDKHWLEQNNRVKQTLSQQFNASAELHWIVSPRTADLILRKTAERGPHPRDPSI